jgi:hypothetical protein
MNNLPKVKENELRDWYYNLPYKKLGEFRQNIIVSCGINMPVFYRWLSGQTPIPHTAKVVINQVAGCKIFDIEDPVTMKETA